MIAERIDAGSSLRGLSSVTMTMSDMRDSHGAHLGPLALIAVAARSEHRDQPAVDMRAKRGDRRLQRIGSVRIIDVDRNALAADHGALEPPAHGRDALHRGEDAVEAGAGRHREARRDQHVGGLIGADQRQARA